MNQRHEGLLGSTSGADDWLYLRLDDGRTVILPPERDCPKELLEVGAHVVDVRTAEGRTVTIAGFVVLCLVAGIGHVGSLEQRPAVLGGVPVVIPADAPPGDTSFGATGTIVPHAPRPADEIDALASPMRMRFGGELQLYWMFLENPRLPFTIEPVTASSIGEARFSYDHGWELPIEVVRLWLAAELSVEPGEPDGRFIRLPESFFRRPGAVRQLERALQKLDRWRSDGEFLEWVEGLKA